MDGMLLVQPDGAGPAQPHSKPSAAQTELWRSWSEVSVAADWRRTPLLGFNELPHNPLAGRWDERWTLATTATHRRHAWRGAEESDLNRERSQFLPDFWLTCSACVCFANYRSQGNVFFYVFLKLWIFFFFVWNTCVRVQLFCNNSINDRKM